jgi:hypothetical protein
MSKTKIVLEQHGTAIPGNVPKGKLKYTVVQLSNRTRPMVGEELTEDDVQQLLTDTPGLSVEIKATKKKR